MESCNLFPRTSKDLCFLYIYTSLNLKSIANIGSFLAKLCQQAKHIVHWLHDWLLPLCCKLIFLTSKFVSRDAGGLGGSRVDNHTVTWTKQMLNSHRLHQKLLKSFQIPWKKSQIINQIHINWKWKPGWLITIGKNQLAYWNGLFNQFSARHMKFLKLKFNRSKPDKKGDILWTHTDNAAWEVFEVWCISLCYELWTHSFNHRGGGQADSMSLQKCSKIE